MASLPSNPSRRDRFFPAAYDKPDRSGFVNPFNDRAILEYYQQLHYWHGFIRFLGLPHLRDEPDVLMDRLFVTPELSPRPLTVEEAARPERRDDRTRLLDAVRSHPRLVVLGDPGSGKSTLVSWIAYQLSRSSKNPWVQALGPLLPLPLVVRDLEIRQEGWDGLLQAFLRRPVARDLEPERVTEYLERGQAIIFLDGLDELTRVSSREALRDAVFEGAERYPGCRFLFTSRVVGYDQVRFDRASTDANCELADAGDDHWESLKRNLRAHGMSVPEVEDGTGKWAEIAYAAPFSDSQIEDFVQRWYARQTEAVEEADRKAADLLRSIRSNPRTLRLARIPNLLTLMALIHRILAQLPHERVVLYSTIVEAYLKSIDTYRGVEEVDYSLEEKKRWLAHVGFRMQQRRSETLSVGTREEKGEILVSEDQVVEWLAESMARSPRTGDAADPRAAARAFVDYIARRSGLLLPRGEGRYAFTHLSMQEYFAALYLEERMTSPHWLRKGASDNSFGPKDLTALADQDAWREPLALLFGLLAGRPDWAEELADLLFGEDFARVGRTEPPEGAARACLLAEAAADPYTGLPGALRKAGWEACWGWEMARQQGTDIEFSGPSRNQVARALFAVGPEEQSAVWSAMLRALECQDRPPTHLDLSGAGVTDVAPLSRMERLTQLDLSGTGVADITVLSGLRQLKLLNLSETNVVELSALCTLTQLEWLDLSQTGVTDVSALSDLMRLKVLDLSGTGVAEIDSLSGLKDLLWLGLAGTAVTEFVSLSDLKRLRVLDLAGTGVTDVGPLWGLERLESLDLSGTGVTDVGPLSDRTSLVIRGVVGSMG